MDHEQTPDPADEVLAALMRVRGRRGRHAHLYREHDAEPGRGGADHGHDGPHPHGAGRHGRPDRRPGRHGAEGWGREGFGGRGGHFGGGMARTRMLDALAAADAPLTVTEIAAAVGVDQPRASRLIQQAVQLELVRREADPADARRTRVVLTDTGRKVARGFRGERREMVQTALAAFTPDERAEFLRLLAKFAAAWPNEDGLG